MKNGKLSIGLIGAGRAGMIHARNLRASVPHAALTAVADPVEAAARAACEELELERFETDYRRILADETVDAVVVVTPTKYHCEIVLEAARAGKHILCEKPMAMTVEECAAMQAKRVVDSGAVGDVVMVRSNTRGPSIPKPWMYDISKSNGPLAEVNSHDIDTLRWFTGSEFASLYAIGGNYRCPDAAADFPDFYDNVVLTASFANGMQGCIDGAQGVLYGYDARVEILGTKGCVFLGKTRETAVTVCTADMKAAEEFTNSWKFLFKDAYLEEDTAFVRCLLEDTPPLVTGHDGKMAVQVVNAGNQSIREKRIVTLDAC